MPCFEIDMNGRSVNLIKVIQLELKLVLLAIGNSQVFDTLFTIV